MPADDDDPFVWLEDVAGERALAWVRARNADSRAVLEAVPGFAERRDQILAILDAQALADALSERPIGEALESYDSERRTATGAIVLVNRGHGPEIVMDWAEERAPGGFGDVSEVFAAGELDAVSDRYKRVAGFTTPQR